ncbi:hypothetical protein JYU14_04775, partial [Simkania negevensis]|nr:hypothetical protein [Simkania negevensis]
MDIEQIKQLMKAMEESGLTKFVLEQEGFKLELAAEKEPLPYPAIPEGLFPLSSTAQHLLPQGSIHAA